MGPRLNGIVIPPEDDTKDLMLHYRTQCVDDLLGDKRPLPGITVRVWELMAPDWQEVVAFWGSPSIRWFGAADRHKMCNEVRYVLHLRLLDPFVPGTSFPHYVLHLNEVETTLFPAPAFVAARWA